MRHLATVLLMVSMSCIADGPPGDPPSHAWKKLRWLEGCWRGTGLGGEITECWVGSGNGIYTGVFQLQHEGKLAFSEIVSLADFDGEPAMRVRHFHPVSLDMKSREGSISTQRFTLRKLGSE